MIVKKRCVCEKEGGCVEQGEPCLMYRSKERWIEAGMPIRDDDKDIVTMLVKVKKKFDAKKNYDKKGKFKEEAKAKFIRDLETTTMNLAPRNWRERIQGDKVMRAEARQRKAAVLEDFVGCNSTRCWCGYGLVLVWLWSGAGVVLVWWCWWWCWCKFWELGPSGGGVQECGPRVSRDPKVSRIPRSPVT